MGNLLSCICGSGETEVIDTSNMAFLHGRIRILVDRAEGLPDTDTAFWNIDAKDFTDPYVTGDLGEARIFKTRYILNDLNPVWEQTFNVHVCHHADSLVINVKDKEHIGASFIASVTIPSEDLLTEETIDDWFDLTNNDEGQGRIHLSIKFTSKESLEEEKDREVKDAYFPLRENNRYILYQDAETPQIPQLEGVTFPDGSPYQPTRCWYDLYQALENAQKFIYITGWSVYTEIQLVRGEDDPDGLSNVGNLLKRKAEEGVRVMLLVWNEKLSTDILPAGFMGTYDEATNYYFQGTDVHCALVGRQKSDGVLADQFVNSCYTHHQKTVICDAEDPDSGLRRVIAFIGGLDITSGRYDTPNFPLFSTIRNLHAGDFHSANCVGATENTGPREPWHDNHARVEGPAAMDIKRNFEERLIKQAEDLQQLLYIVTEDEFVPEDTAPPMPENEGGLWNLQLFRSITSDSAIFDIDKHGCLHTKGGRYVDNTIMRCMIQQIRNAKNFIYMENQYFLGSAFDWIDDKSTVCHNLIPIEIAYRIVDKINAGETFTAYINIPMFPEGDPSSGPSQEILFWQYRTMQSMYHTIVKAIQANDAGTQPTDYLKFFCLGKREGPDEVPVDELDEPTEGTLPQTIRCTLRQPVYVHSKMTIVDDEYILIGSANINQRSLSGERDSEIAMGGYQPGHTVDEEGDPRGDIHTYRMALWSAHFGGYDEVFQNPNSDECREKVTEVSQGFWELYTADDPEHSDVHMLPYPISVDSESGDVTALESPWDCFPDTSANVLGHKSCMPQLPIKLTT